MQRRYLSNFPYILRYITFPFFIVYEKINVTSPIPLASNPSCFTLLFTYYSLYNILVLVCLGSIVSFSVYSCPSLSDPTYTSLPTTLVHSPPLSVYMPYSVLPNVEVCVCVCVCTCVCVCVCVS